MNEKRQLKEDYKRLKSLVKKHPRLFARLAAVEIEFGKLKAARKRLTSGIAKFPDHTSARTLLAECLSQLGDHKASLKQWEDVVYSEPFNARARAGYVRELAFLERTPEMSEAIADYYGLDPLDDEISDRHQEALLRAIRRQNASIRVWNPQWHPGDFTPAGAIARAVSSRLGLTTTREDLPDEFRPEANPEIVDQLVGELEAVAHSAPAGGDSAAFDVDSDEEEALAALFEEGEGLDSEMGDDDSDLELDVEAEEEALIDELDAEAGTEEEEEEVTTDDSEVALDEEADVAEEVSEELPDEVDVDAETETEAAEEADEEIEAGEELEEEEIEEEPEPEPEPVDKLVEALEHVEIDSEGMSDIEKLVEDLTTDRPYLVEEPTVEIQAAKVPVKKRVGAKADTVKAEPSEITETPSLDVSIEADLTPAGGEAEESPSIEELEGDLSQDTLDEVLSNAPAEEAADSPADDGETLSEEELASLADEDAPAETKDEPSEPTKVMSQDDLDALIAERARESSQEVEKETTPEEPPASSGGSMSQSELDALIASRAAESSKEPAAEEVAEDAEPEVEEKSSGPMSQSDLDALIASRAGSAQVDEEIDQPEAEIEAETPEAEAEVDTEDDEPEVEIEAESEADATAAEVEPVAEEEALPEQEPEEAAVEPPAEELPESEPVVEEIEEPVTTEEAKPSGPLTQEALDALVEAQKLGVKPEEIKPAESSEADLPDDPRKGASTGAISQEELDAILSGERGKPQEVSYDFSDEEDEDDTPPFVSEDLEGELDQSLLDELLEPAEESSDVPDFHEDMPGDELTQDILDEVYKPTEEAETATSDDSLSQKDLDKLFSEPTADEEEPVAADEPGEEAGFKVPEMRGKGTPTLEDLQKKLDELELISEEHKSSVEPDELDAETEDLDKLLEQMSGLEASQDDEIAELEPSESEIVIEDEGEEIEIEELEEADELLEVDLEEELPPPDLESDPLDSLTTVEETPEPEPVEKTPPSKKSISAEALAEAMRKPTTPRPTPRPASEAEEVPPEEFKGPLTKTFAKLCLAQGKVDHANYVVEKLLADSPGDVDLVSLQQKIDEARAGG